MLSKTKKPFLFEIVYFKNNGKFYTNEIVEWKTRYHEKTGYPYMEDAFRKLRGLIASESQLPGLSTSWKEGYIFINHEEGFPQLFLPTGA